MMNMMPINKIRKMSEREHVLCRSAMYIGATTLTKTMDFVYDKDKKRIVYKELEYVPGLIKIINEIIDNSIDVAIKTNFKYANNIKIKMNEEWVEVSDNGTGIPVVKNSDGHYLPELAWGHARSGSNFDNDEERIQIGMNGVGSFATNCFSRKFIGCSDDGKKKYTIIFKNNAESYSEKIQKSSGVTGVTVKFWPDFEKFGIEKIDRTHMSIIEQRLINLSICFPEINFKFNNKKIKTTTFRQYARLFGDDFEIYETPNYKFAIFPNKSDESDNIQQFSYVNGLKIPDGGTHIDIIANSIVTEIRERLKTKYKTIKPSDIKNKLMIVAFLKNFKNPKFNSQSKEKITNSVSEMNSYFGNIPFKKIALKIYKNKAIMEPIIEVYKIKDEFKRRQELKNLKKTRKRIKSDKYYPSIGSKKYLLIVEGESAFGGLSPVFGRKDCGYYILKGKPLNAYSAPQSKVLKNKELSELYKIIYNEKYEYIIQATDQDLDGFHIRGLLIGFFDKYLPEYKKRIGMLQTPVIIVTKGNKLVRWYYKLNERIELKSGEKSKYMKGLGSWDSEELKHVVQIDGLDKMIDFIEFDNEKIIDEWLGTDSEPRKKYILDNDFNLSKL